MATQSGPSWKVAGQAPNQTEVDGAGNVVEGTRVYFQMGDGTAGSVFIPQNQYNVATVKARIAEQAEHIHGVSNLTSH